MIGISSGKFERHTNFPSLVRQFSGMFDLLSKLKIKINFGSKKVKDI